MQLPMQRINSDRVELFILSRYTINPIFQEQRFMSDETLEVSAI